MSHLELLVNGYIRIIQTQCMQTQIIPKDINKLCLLYCEVNTIICVFPKKWFIADIPARSSDLLTMVHLCATPSLGSYDSTGLCVATNIKISPQTFSQILPASFNKQWDIVFKCGASHHSHAVFFRPSNSRSIDDHQIAYHIQLAALPISYYGGDVVFSKKKGLFFVGGYKQNDSEKVYNLPLNNQYEIEMNNKWNLLPLMKRIRYKPSAVFIGDNINIDEKLIVIGGDHNGMLDSVELFDFGKNEWNNIASVNVKRRETGTYYDCFDNNSKIYIGGGFKDKSAQSFEYYDINKNKWYMLPNSIKQHRRYPALWIENKTQLFAASISKFGAKIEFIDLRNSTNKWNQIYGPNINCQSFEDVFGAKADSLNAYSRFLKCIY